MPYTFGDVITSRDVSAKPPEQGIKGGIHARHRLHRSKCNLHAFYKGTLACTDATQVCRSWACPCTSLHHPQSGMGRDFPLAMEQQGARKCGRSSIWVGVFNNFIALCIAMSNNLSYQNVSTILPQSPDFIISIAS